MSNVEVIDTKQEIIIKAQEFGVGEETQLSLANAYKPFLENAQAWAEQAHEITVTDIEDKDGMKKARAMRLQLKDLRISLDKKRKELKNDALQKGKAIDTIARNIKEMIEPSEKYLQEQEDFAKREQERIVKELTESRSKQLDEYGFDYTFVNLGEMSDEQYASLLDTAKTAHETKVKAEQEAAEAERKRQEEEAEKERQRIAAEKAEQERIRKENERLKAEQEAREREIEAERKKQEAALKAEQERREKELAAERAKAEEERKAREAAEKKRLAQEEKKRAEEQARLDAERKQREAEEQKRREEEAARLEAERKEREKAEAEARRLREAEEKRQAEEQARLKAEEEADDRDKLINLIAHIADIKLSSDEGKRCQQEAIDVIRKSLGLHAGNEVKS